MFRIPFVLIFVLAVNSNSFAQASYDGQRWFQIEVTIFTNDYGADFNRELIAPQRLVLGYPEDIRRLIDMADFFQVEAFSTTDIQNYSAGELVLQSPSETSVPEVSLMQQYFDQLGPTPGPAATNIRLPDPERDPFILLPASLSDFQTTNSRLERAPEHRVMFHGLWRQPVLNTADAVAILVNGGNQFDDHYELEGSLTIRFNNSQDRVVIDANIWLSQFTLELDLNQDTDLPLPPNPLSDQNSEAAGPAVPAYTIRNVVQMVQSRDMRSNEFHYLDHPALGLVISVFPYELPSPMMTDDFMVPSDPVQSDIGTLQTNPTSQ